MLRTVSVLNSLLNYPFLVKPPPDDIARDIDIYEFIISVKTGPKRNEEVDKPETKNSCTLRRH